MESAFTGEWSSDETARRGDALSPRQALPLQTPGIFIASWLVRL